MASYGNNTFQYGADGIRYKKNNTVYTLDGSKILQETDGTKTIKYYYGHGGVVGFNYNGTDYYYEKNLQGDITAIYNTSGVKQAEYVYDAWGKILSMTDSAGNGISNNTSHVGYLNPFRYRGYYYDVETDLYYLESRYYDPETGRFLNADSLSYLGEGSDLQNSNLYSYCENNPVMYSDPSGHAPWWSWALSGLQFVGGIALCFVPGMQGFGASLAIGGAVGLIMNALEPQVAQFVGGATSAANGYGAISTGASLINLGGWASVAGLGLMLVGVATMGFGTNEMIDAVTGTNYIQQWTGISDEAYSWTYLGLNFASSVGQAAGNMYRLHATRKIRYARNNIDINGYRYYDGKGEPFFDFDYPHGNIKENHWHGWNGPGLTNRSEGNHWNYLELIWWMFGGM